MEGKIGVLLYFLTMFQLYSRFEIKLFMEDHLIFLHVFETNLLCPKVSTGALISWDPAFPEGNNVYNTAC